VRHVEHPWLLTNRQFQWTGNGHSQLPLSELGKPIDLLRTTGSNGKSVNNFHCLTLTLTYDLDLQSQTSQGQGRPSCQKSKSKVKQFKQESAQSTWTHTHTHKQTDTHTDAIKRIIHPATRLIKTNSGVHFFTGHAETLARTGEITNHQSIVYSLTNMSGSCALKLFSVHQCF